MDTKGVSPLPPPPEPLKPPPAAKPPSPGGAGAPDLSSNPFAQMFAKLGVPATAQQLTEMMNNYIKSILDTIKKDQARDMKALRKMRDVIEGRD